MTKTIGKKIEQRREQLNIKPLAFAKKIGITTSRLWELENTSTRPSAEVLLKVADALDKSILYFLTDEDNDEDVLLVKYRKLSADRKKLAIEIIKILNN